MIDGISIISRKDKGFEKRVICNDPFEDLLTESEKRYFWDYDPELRICDQCAQDHYCRPDFRGVKTSIEHIPELISVIFKEDSIKNA